MTPLLYLIPLVILLWLFWVQRRRQQSLQAAREQLEVGSQVGTTSGLLGTLVALDDEVATIEAAPGVHLRFDRRAVVPHGQLVASRKGATGGSGATAARGATGAGASGEHAQPQDAHPDVPSADQGPDLSKRSTDPTDPETKAD